MLTPNRRQLDFRLVFVLLLVVTFISVYFIPAAITRIIFIIILYSAWQSKNDYVYFAWFFVVSNAPGRLFSAEVFNAERIPIYPVISGISVSFYELFVILYIIKILVTKQNYSFLFKKQFILFYLVAGIYVLYGFLLGTSMDEIIKTWRALVPWSLVLIIPAYINNSETVKRVSMMLFPLVFLALVSQLHSYYTGTYWDYLLRGVNLELLSSSNQEVPSRSYSAVWIVFYSLVQALYYLLEGRNTLNKNYLSVVVFVALLSIYLSATRGWIIAFGTLIIGVFTIFRLSKNIGNIIRVGIFSVVLFIFLVSSFQTLKTELLATSKRASTIKLFAEGDITAGGTLSRFDVKGPRVMKKFKESPILGWGFSSDYFEYRDGHVGHHNLLLNTGIAGYVYLNLLFLFFLYKILIITRNNPYVPRATLIYFLALVSIYIIHSSSTSAWGFDIGGGVNSPAIQLYAFLFSSLNVIYYNYYSVRV